MLRGSQSGKNDFLKNNGDWNDHQYAASQIADQSLRSSSSSKSTQPAHKLVPTQANRHNIPGNTFDIVEQPNQYTQLNRISSAARSIKSETIEQNPYQQPIQSILQQGIAELQSTRLPDGTWTMPFTGGPFHACLGLIAEVFVGSYEHSPEQLDCVLALLEQQQPDGGFAVYPGGGSSKAVTQLLVHLWHALLKRQPHRLSTALQKGLEKSIQQAQRYIVAGIDTPTPQHISFLTKLIGDLLHPSTHDQIPNMHISGLASGAIQIGLFDMVQPMFYGMGPAIAVLMSTQAARQSRSIQWIQSLIHSRDVNEQKILEGQDKDGGWIWTVMGTALNMMALHALGYSNESKEIQAGLGYIHRLRTLTPDTAFTHATSEHQSSDVANRTTRPSAYTEHAIPKESGHGINQEGNANQRHSTGSWTLGDTWSTAINLSTLHMLHQSWGEQADLKATIESLIDAQLPDGRWSFSLGGSGHDNDTTSMILEALAQWWGSQEAASSTEPKLSAPLKRKLKHSLQKAVAALLDQQQSSGGFGAFEKEALWQFGNTPPNPMESLMIDAATPDVTARVICGLTAARDANLLSPALTRQLNRCLTQALGYFKKSAFVHNDEGGTQRTWWSRWIVGTLSSQPFVLKALRNIGLKSYHPWLRQAQHFLEHHQNTDGGWGESHAVDQDVSRCGQGPSTVLQTAFGCLAYLQTVERPIAKEQRAVLERAIAYILKHYELDNRKSLHLPLGTVASGVEYYTAPNTTRAFVLQALASYQEIRECIS